MEKDRLLNIKEAAHFLGKSQDDIKALLKSGKLEAYQIGGMYLRFKLEQLQEFKDSLGTYLPSTARQTRKRGLKFQQLPLRDNVKDFFYFNDFYILAILIIAALIIIILKNIS